MRKLFGLLLAATLAMGLFIEGAIASPRSVHAVRIDPASNCGQPFRRLNSATETDYFTDYGRPGNPPGRVTFGIETWGDNCPFSAGRSTYWYAYALVDQSYYCCAHPSANQATLFATTSGYPSFNWKGYSYYNPAQSDQIDVQSPTVVAYDPGLTYYVGTSNTVCCTPDTPYAYNPAWVAQFPVAGQPGVVTLANGFITLSGYL